MLILPHALPHAQPRNMTIRKPCGENNLKLKQRDLYAYKPRETNPRLPSCLSARGKHTSLKLTCLKSQNENRTDAPSVFIAERRGNVQVPHPAVTPSKHFWHRHQAHICTRFRLTHLSEQHQALGITESQAVMVHPQHCSKSAHGRKMA